LFKIQTRQKVPKKLWFLSFILIILFIASIVGVRQYYFANLKPASDDKTKQIVTIPSGATVDQISSELYGRHLISSPWVFDWYIHSQNLNNKLEAGTFALSPSYSLQKIASIIASGHVAEGVVTIVPGTTVAQIETTFITAGFSRAEVEQAFNPNNYNNVPVLAYKPKSVTTLEGLLYPDSFDKTSATSASYIVKESLDEMSQHITASVQKAFASEGLSVYQGLTLASIIEQEVSNHADRPEVAQVFLSRLKEGIPLGSDVTANYGAILNHQPPSLTYDSAYNTLLHKGLPPTPIGTVSNNAIISAAYPAHTNWQYFVTGDNGVTYFEKTLSQHNSDVSQYCHKLCAQP